MYATLYHFLRMTPAEQATVTTLDLSIADPEDFWRLPPEQAQLVPHSMRNAAPDGVTRLGEDGE